MIKVGFALLISLCTALPVMAADNINLLGTRLQARLEDGADYPYNRVLNYMLPRLDGAASFDIYPSRRVTALFRRLDNACVFPSNLDVAASDNPDFVDFDLIGSDVVDRLTAHIFVPKGTTVPHKPSDLANKNVAYMRGLEFVKQFGDETTRFYEADGQYAYLRMLKEGRVDMALGWMPGLVELARRTGMEVPDYDPDWPLTTVSLQVVCKGSPASEAFLRDFNVLLTQMRANGKLKELLGYERL